jgi:hypothetical protein
VRTSRTGEYEQLRFHPLREPARELKVCWASMLSRSVKMPLNLTDQHAQSDGGKSETPSAGDDEPLWRADFLRCEASSHNPTLKRIVSVARIVTATSTAGFVTAKDDTSTLKNFTANLPSQE